MYTISCIGICSKDNKGEKVNMRVLYICNYDAWNKISKDAMANHHLFGFAYWIEKWVYDDNGMVSHAVFKDEFFGGGYIYFIKIKSTYDFRTLTYIYNLSKNFDLIYDTLNNCKLLGLLKKIGIMKCKLISIMHYPPFHKQFLVSKSDGYIFFDKKYYNYAVEDCTRNKQYKSFYINEWKPDKRWYWEKIKELNIEPNHGSFFVDNGKTLRDHQLLYKVCNDNKLPLLMCSNEHINSEFVTCYHIDDFSDETIMIRKIYGSQCIVIPTIKMDKMGPIGITSFLDAIAYEIPVICSDNTCFAEIVSQYGLGLVYKAGSEKSLSEKMINIYNDVELYEKCKKNMIDYSNSPENSLIRYSLNLKEIIEEVFKEPYL